MASPALELRGVYVDIGVADGTLHAVNDLSFSVNAGETFALVGESGCGKTMTALAIMGLLPRRGRVSAGTIALDGLNVANMSEKTIAGLRGNRVSMIFQDPMTSLNPVLTIGTQLEEVFVRHGKGTSRQARARAEFLLERIGIISPAARLAQYPHQLSGGLRQRMMIAMALMCEPTLLIADEPTTALDVTVQAQILRLLADLQRTMNLALVLITHDLGIVARMADRVAVMYAGQIVETAPCEALFARPSHPYTKGLLECIPSRRRGERLGAIPGLVPSLIGDTTGCQFRNRCGEAIAACAEGQISARSVSPDHICRCVHIPDAAPKRVAAVAS
ncbi:MAG: ABC transporter ATP-binding protein [Xanthobacteraceae bacterium]